MACDLAGSHIWIEVLRIFSEINTERTCIHILEASNGQVPKRGSRGTAKHFSTKGPLWGPVIVVSRVVLESSKVLFFRNQRNHVLNKWKLNPKGVRFHKMACDFAGPHSWIEMLRIFHEINIKHTSVHIFGASIYPIQKCGSRGNAKPFSEIGPLLGSVIVVVRVPFSETQAMFSST